MMLSVLPANSHLDDVDLLRYVDRELSGSEAAQAGTHLATCARCAQRLEEVERQATQMSRFLADLVIAPLPDERRAHSLAEIQRAAARAARPRFAGAPWLRAAAAVLVLFASVAAGAEPVRAWVVQKWDRLVTPLLGGPSSAVVLEKVVEPNSPLISFVPSREIFTINLAHPQQQGTVTLAIAETPRALAQIRGGDNESITVLPDGVRIENSEQSVASYRVAVPSSLGAVVVRIADGPIVSIGVADRDLPWMKYFDLGEVGRGEQGLIFRQ